MGTVRCSALILSEMIFNLMNNICKYNKRKLELLYIKLAQARTFYPRVTLN
jgi:hypothetical protein